MANVRTRRELRLAGRINLVVVSTLILGLGLVAYLFASSLTQSRESLSDSYLQREADILYLSIENFMMPGEAPIAAMFLEDVSSLGSGFELALYRRNGVPAFSDNVTIDQVNTNQKLQIFSQRLGPSSMPPLSPEQNYFARAVAIPPESVFFARQAAGRSYKRVYRPLLNLPKCTTCHGSDHTIRGVIDIEADLSDVVRDQNITVAASVAGFAIMALALAAIIGRILRAVVVMPVLAIGRLCQNVTGGDFTGRVDVNRKDEIGGLALTVNRMVEGLRERSELTKYVSAGTITSLASDQGPTRAERTLLFSDVRGFTAYTELHGAEAIVTVLNKMLERQASIITSHGGDIDKFVGDEVVAVFSGDDAPERACLAAIDIMVAVAAGAADFDNLTVGIGIASGQVVHGMLGSSLRADFTVVGDAVNVAARLCSKAKSGQILVCDCSMARLPPGVFKMSGPYKARLKGKAEAQVLYLLEGRATQSGARNGKEEVDGESR